MKFGICTIDPLLAAEAREAGFDYLEVPVPALQKPLEGEDAFLRAMEEASGLACAIGREPPFFWGFFQRTSHFLAGNSSISSELQQPMEAPSRR